MNITKLIALFLVSGNLCAAQGVERSFSWWMLPENTAELPHEIEEDDSQNWTEMWYRPDGDTSANPIMVMEQGLGLRWTGTDFDAQGIPGQAYIIFGGSKVAQIKKDVVRLGTITSLGDKIVWVDNATQELVDYKKRRRRGRRTRSAKTRIRFGKIAMPTAATAFQLELNSWSMENLEKLLASIAKGPSPIPVRNYSAITQMEDQNGSLLGFRYGDSCSYETRVAIENIVGSYVEPRLSCAALQNKELTQKLFAVFLQRPVLECKLIKPMTENHCGMASLPVYGPFFASRPMIALNLKGECEQSIGDTLLHEIFHLTGVKETETELLDKYVQNAESCGASKALLSFDNSERGEFFNSAQVETRMLLFRSVRDQAVSKWGWLPAERDFVLGTICSHMGDRSCSRKYFEQAASGQLVGTVDLPEGGHVTWSALGQYMLYDETTEDTFRMRTRMRELAKYLRKDPHGVLLKRGEYSGTRLHEYFVVRTALEKVRGNKNLCDDTTDDRIYCEDLSSIAQTPWFKK